MEEPFRIFFFGNSSNKLDIKTGKVFYCLRTQYYINLWTSISILTRGGTLELDRGYLIVFEGIDGTGKSTHCKMLNEFLEGEGFPTVSLREPTNGYWGKKIRGIINEGRDSITPEEELSWFMKDRLENVEKNIQPALDQKKIVLMDRYYYSTAAYQGALGFDPEDICRKNEKFAPVPDVVFLFTNPPEDCLARIAETRGSGHDAFEQLDYLKKVQKIFDTFIGPKFLRIDTGPPQDVVHAQVRKGIEDLIPIRKNA